MRIIKKLNERYSFIEKISGRKSVNVYLGYDEITGSKIIIKEIIGLKTSKENDFSILRRLRHPGLPTVCDAFEMNSAMYIIMEYLSGENLRDYIALKGSLNETEALRIIIDILEVLDYMHSFKQRPLIHGDIKPENIIFNKNRAILIDFGSVDTEDASSGFCAPERFAGIAKSIESDIYSAGEILHYMLSGNVKKVYSRKKSPVFDNDVYRLIDKSTRKLPSDRYHKAADMAAESKRLLELREAGVNQKNKSKIISVPGCPEAACEIACSICELDKKVLIADLDMLSPAVHTVLGINKFEYCLQDFMSGNPMELKTNCFRTKKNGLQMLSCRTDYENYERAGEDCITALLAGAAGFFDFVVISCSGFPYDKYFIDSLLYSDVVIFPIVKGVIDIRKYNSMAKFMCNRQNISKEKIFYMGMDINEYNVGPLIAVGAVETSWIGSVPNCHGRRSLYTTGDPYVFSMNKKIYSRYVRILNRTGVLK